MGRIVQTRFQVVVLLAIVVATTAGVIWIIGPDFGNDVSPEEEAAREQAENAAYITSLTDVIARAGEFEIRESIVAGVLNARLQSGEQFDTDETVRQAVDAAVIQFRKLQIAEREGLEASDEDANRSMELARASCDTDASCGQFVNALVEAGVFESPDAYWSESVEGYREDLTTVAVNRHLAGEDASDPAAWLARLRDAELALLEDVEIEWIDPEYESSYVAASR